MEPKPRIVVAGQIPPPMGGQNAMIGRLLDDLRLSGEVITEHLPFRFTPNAGAARKGGIGKLVELARVLFRLGKLRARGPIELLVYPTGGPQTVPLLRDLLLLPWILLTARKVVLHFHAAGIADVLARGSRLATMASRLYAICGNAIVMTRFNARDPEACGIRNIAIIPHALDDVFEERTSDTRDGAIRILAMGHLCADKGTPNLIRAVAELKSEFPGLLLELAGEPLAPYTSEQIEKELEVTGLRGSCRLLGVVGGAEKKAAFQRADLFVFPSVAPYESFGLVLVEAMMWKLPIVASDWRGNRDVLGTSPRNFLFSPAHSLEALRDALRDVLSLRDQWPAFAAANREAYEKNFRADPAHNKLVNHLVSLVRTQLETHRPA